MKHRIRIAVALVALISGCASCEQPEEAPPAAAPAPQAANEPSPEAPAPAEPAPAAAEDADCFVILDASPDYGPVPLKVEFTADVDCTSGEATYSWDFGDGSPISSEEKPVHTYAKTGEFTATVTVTGTGGGTDSDELDILVEEQ